MSAAISLKRAGRPAIMVMVRTRGAREAPPPPLAGLGGRSLSDEELAWRLHQELNAGMGSPALHTRTRNPGTSTEGTSGEGATSTQPTSQPTTTVPAARVTSTQPTSQPTTTQRARRPGAAAAPRGSRAHADPGALTAKEVYGSILGALGACVAGQEGVADLARCGSWDNPAKPLLFSACGGWSETRWHVGGAAAPPRILEVSSDLFAPRALALEEVGARPPLPLFH
ncbi:hypothetical protein APUTEX25_004282 [Auxenochlorella protothecoides]|uniref:Uncharacterized protein n=1 Tax=Auxenochlorella protothecoides TaxID=3075 RepID=A0A3M7L3Z2_AUXPR|nr:hypothetical protein APUTEX25_004282 [Auxenochlorella protothecoides]|eukprot:RMZ57448.1 hypothetical protein APUTEX25_004282 [Auxenochlorella protothecoides]